MLSTSLSRPAAFGAYAIVADPDLVRASSYREALGHFHLETLITRDGREAVDIMGRHGPPRVLVVDVSLPHVDGLSVVRALRQTAPATEAAAIALSGYDELRDFASSRQRELQISSVLRHSGDQTEFKNAVGIAIGALDAALRPPAPATTTFLPVSPSTPVEEHAGSSLQAAGSYPGVSSQAGSRAGLASQVAGAQHDPAPARASQVAGAHRRLAPGLRSPVAGAVRSAFGRLSPAASAHHDRAPAPATANARLTDPGHEAPAQVDTIITQAVSETIDAFPELAATMYVRLGDRKWYRSALKSLNALSASPSLGALVRRVFETGETLILPDIGRMPAWQDRDRDSRRLGLVAVPVGAARDRTIGVLYLSGPSPLQLPSYELDVLLGIARKAGATLQPYVAALARLPTTVRLSPEQFDRLSREAIEDPLTGLTNRHGGEIAMGRELARARREKRALSLVLIDVDHFKQVNDTRGHAVGDRVLRGIARIAIDCVRASDLVVRWGGEEFLVVLPSVAVDGAREIAERIRSRVERAPTEPARVTISAGTTEVQPADDLRAALARADTMLHRAKAEGRNRVL